MNTRIEEPQVFSALRRAGGGGAQVNGRSVLEQLKAQRRANRAAKKRGGGAPPPLPRGHARPRARVLASAFRIPFLPHSFVTRGFPRPGAFSSFNCCSRMTPVSHLQPPPPQRAAPRPSARLTARLSQRASLPSPHCPHALCMPPQGGGQRGARGAPAGVYTGDAVA